MSAEKEKIFVVDDRADEKFLRRKTLPFTLSPKGEFVHQGKVFSKKDVASLLNKMRRAMRLANGIGLSANQIGLPYKLFVAQVPDSQGEEKFYAVFNPEIERAGSEKDVAEEGCLSVPGIYGEIERHTRLTLRGLDKNGKPIKIKAWALLARVFQHETDHLNGALIVDRAKSLRRSEPPES